MTEDLPDDPCLDSDLLAGLAEGTVDERERDLALAHLAACTACRETARELAQVLPAASRGVPSGRALRWVAAAAVLLVGVGALLVAGRGGGREDSGTLLASAARRLAREVPERFAGFEPLTREELARVREPVRGDAGQANPGGRVLEPRPVLEWLAVPGARRYVVTVLGSGGRLWSRETDGTSLAWPAEEGPLSPGSPVVWTLEADDPRATHAERVLVLVGEEDAAAWRAAREAVEARVEAPLRWLVLAHLALRRDLPAEAADLARRWLEAVPGDALGEATRAHARARSSGR